MRCLATLLAASKCLIPAELTKVHGELNGLLETIVYQPPELHKQFFIEACMILNDADPHCETHWGKSLCAIWRNQPYETVVADIAESEAKREEAIK